MALRPTTLGSRRDVQGLTRFAYVGAISAGTVGAIVGLVVGLVVNPPTAWFAALEVGVPVALAGGVVGLLVGLVAALVMSTARRITRRHAQSYE